MKLSFSSSGLEKLKEGVRTEKAQKLLSGEFLFRESTLLLMPTADAIADGTLELKSNVTGLPEQDVRLEVDTTGGVLRIPVMKLKAPRAGTDDVVFRLAYATQPLEIRLVVSVSMKSEPHAMNLSTSFQTNDFSRINGCVKFIDALFAGGDLRIYNLTSDRLHACRAVGRHRLDPERSLHAHRYGRVNRDLLQGRLPTRPGGKPEGRTFSVVLRVP